MQWTKVLKGNEVIQMEDDCWNTAKCIGEMTELKSTQLFDWEKPKLEKPDS